MGTREEREHDDYLAELAEYEMGAMFDDGDWRATFAAAPKMIETITSALPLFAAANTLRGVAKGWTRPEVIFEHTGSETVGSEVRSECRATGDVFHLWPPDPDEVDADRLWWWSVTGPHVPDSVGDGFGPTPRWAASPRQAFRDARRFLREHQP